MAIDKRIHSWRDIQMLLSSGDESALEQLNPAQVQMVALAQLVETGKPVKSTRAPKTSHRYQIKSGTQPE